MELTIKQKSQIYNLIRRLTYFEDTFNNRVENHTFTDVENGLIDYYLIFSHADFQTEIKYLNFGTIEREMIVADEGIIETLTKYLNDEDN